jgi:hypothetical protein
MGSEKFGHTREKIMGPFLSHKTYRTISLSVLLAYWAASPIHGQDKKALANSSIQLEVSKVYDPLVKTNALQLLVPAGWKTSGGIVWHHDKATLAHLEMRCFDPASLQQVEFLPLMPFVWEPDFVFAYPPGSNYVGNEMQAPIEDVQKFITTFVVPRYRAKHPAKVVGFQALPDLAGMVALKEKAKDGLERKVLAGRTRVESTVNGQPVEEDIYCVLTFVRNPLNQRVVAWGTERIYAIRSAKGQLQADAPLLLAVAQSPRWERDWFNLFVQISQMWFADALQNIRNEGILTQIIAKTNREISEARFKMWRSWQEGRDKATQQFCQAIAGVESYHSPYHNYPVELPSGYHNAWVGPHGQYLLSAEVGFDPNANSSVTWVPLKKLP